MPYYDEKDKLDDMISDINYGHTPDSVKDDAIKELRRRGFTDTQIEKLTR